jgi:phospholipid-binding lipoprotein MlaA
MNHSLLALLLGTSLLLTACAGGQDPSDPLEGLNRATFGFNKVFDDTILEPAAKGYKAVVPQPARTSIRNVIHNLKEPTAIANNILQGDITGAADSATRLTVNTLLGLGGLVDVASMNGLNYAEEDFGQTLGVWGVGTGPYIVLPFLGPSNVRDTTGLIVDNYSDPLNLYLNNTDKTGWMVTRIAVSAVDKREELLGILTDLKQNSVDYYSAMKSTYTQRREALIRDNKADDSSLPDIR